MRGQLARVAVRGRSTLSRVSEEPLRSTVHDVADAYEANELFQDSGWTDGLPIVPPTEGLVRRFLDTAALGPADVVGIEPVRRRRITAEKVTIAAVMAGCRPEYVPVVTALVRAVCDWTAACAFSEITLTTFRAVRWNMPFYARMGFEPVPERERRATLREVVDDETARGLDPEARCVMRYRVGRPRSRRG